MITRKHLAIFKTVAKTKSMSKAAKLLYISQPTISQKIQEIEDEYQVKLFERYSKTLFISEEGQTLLVKANQILNLYDEIEHIFTKTKQFPLKIGATLTIGSTLISPILKKLKDKYQDITFQVYIDNTNVIEEKLLNNTLDIALVEGTIINQDLIVEPVIKDRVVFVCAQDYPLNNVKVMSLTELSLHPFIDREQGSGTRNQLDECLKNNNIFLEPAWQCHSWESVKQAVLNGHGIALMPMKIIENEVIEKSIQVINVNNISIERDFSICYHKNKSINKKMQAFIKTGSILKLEGKYILLQFSY
ncbi:LysR family transcriptional regulator, partial [Thomasclavelia ramosa]|uniref:LysR family transcriptional regulator n=3 Tax=Erysipelotrichales TaxID=526525 RepID=UPI000FF3BFC5